MEGSQTVATEISAAEHAELEATFAELDDVELLRAFMVLLSSAPSEQPLFGGISVKSATATRIAFIEIANRWIPADLIDAVIRELGIRDEPRLHLVR